MRIIHLALIVCAAFLGAATDLAGQGVAVVMRSSILRSGPNKTSTVVDHLASGDLVVLMNRHQSGYVRVQSDEEQVGWVIERNIKTLDEADVHMAETHHDTLATVAPSVAGLAVEPGNFDGCPVTGNPSRNGSRYAEIMERNTLKNRSAVPGDGDVDPSVTIARLVGNRSDDTHAFNEGKAADIVAYVLHVKPGGKTETTNCRDSTAAHRDTHIELTIDESDTLPARRVIVEVTPRWRKALADQQHVDWATTTLQHTIEHKWVRVRGWLFFDSEHAQQSENTHPGGETNWRATSWELHPLSRIEVVKRP